MLNSLSKKPISVERARVQYFRSVNDLRVAANGMERDKAREIYRKAKLILEHSQRMERGRKEARARAKTRRRVDWNVAVF